MGWTGGHYVDPLSVIADIDYSSMSKDRSDDLIELRDNTVDDNIGDDPNLAFRMDSGVDNDFHTNYESDPPEPPPLPQQQWLSAGAYIDYYGQEPTYLPNGDIRVPSGFILPKSDQYYYDGHLRQYIDVFDLLQVADRRAIARINLLPDNRREAARAIIKERAVDRWAIGGSFDEELWGQFN